MRPFCYTRPVTVYTVGHSTRTLPDFLALLAAYGVAGVADVRSFPASRRHPHFARPALGRAGIRYDWLRELGGRRRARPGSPHTAWRVAGFRGYADHMDTPEFRAGLARLLGFAAERPTAVLCAEAVPWRCHRQLLADALVVRGLEVVHLLAPDAVRRHTLSPLARVEGERLIYDAGQPALIASRRGRDRP